MSGQPSEAGPLLQLVRFAATADEYVWLISIAGTFLDASINASSFGRGSEGKSRPHTDHGMSPSIRAFLPPLYDACEAAIGP